MYTGNEHFCQVIPVNTLTALFIQRTAVSYAHCLDMIRGVLWTTSTWKNRSGRRVSQWASLARCPPTATQTDKLPTHTLATVSEEKWVDLGREWTDEERWRRVRRYRTHRSLQPSGPGAARPQSEAVARGRFPSQPRVLRSPCGKKQGRGTPVNK